MKIYTRSGDKGRTSLYSGERLPKNAPRIEAIGALDELVAVLGVAKAELAGSPIGQAIEQVQAELYLAMADVATLGDAAARLVSGATDRLEAGIDAMQAQLPPLTEFVIPGGVRSSALLHHARTVCRTAERRLVELAEAEALPREILPYVNRLADYLFVLARQADSDAGAEAPAFKDRL